MIPAILQRKEFRYLTRISNSKLCEIKIKGQKYSVVYSDFYDAILEEINRRKKMGRW